MNSKTISDIEDLKARAMNANLACCILLAGGAARSSKDIYYEAATNTFDVFHEIDGYTETLDEEELLESNIGKALRIGALVRHRD